MKTFVEILTEESIQLNEQSTQISIKRTPAIDYIEGQVGCYSAEWHTWPNIDIGRLYFYCCVCNHKKITPVDMKRVGVTEETIKNILL